MIANTPCDRRFLFMHDITIEHIIPFIEAHRYLGYTLLFFAMVFEGEIFLILAAIVSHLGAFDIFDVYFIALAGVIVGNIAWYYLGVVASKNSFTKRVIPRAERIMEYFLPQFRERPFSSIFFSKFIYGVNHVVVFMSGVMRINLALFIKAESLASIVWVTFHTVVGYLFGYAAIQITHTASRFILLITIFVVVFILIQKLLVYFYERRKHRELKKDNNPQR